MSGRGPRTAAGRFAVGAAAALAAFALLAVAIDRLLPEPEGPESSAYATAPAGLAAYAELLRRSGHRVVRRRSAMNERPAPAPGLLVVLDAGPMEPEEGAAIAAWVRGGGRLVAGGARGVSWLRSALRAPMPGWQAGTQGSARVLAPVPETAGVRSVRTFEGSALRAAGGALPILGSAGAPVALLMRAGRGRVVVLADASPLQNRGLAAEDGAAFGLALAGPRGGTVTFLETVHGYGAASGLAALPARGRWALAGLLLAGLAFAWSHARRIGPPEERTRPLPPPRADYVDALAGSLARTRRPAEVAAPLREAARDAVARRAGLGPEPGDGDLRAAAARLGLGEAETAALLAPPEGLEEALAAGRALAIVDGRSTG